MNALNFIQQHGVEKARDVVEGAPEHAEVYADITKTYFKSPSCIYDKKLSVWEDMDRGMDLDLYEEQIWLEDLKRLVGSVDLVKSYGGIINAKHDVKFLDLDWDYDSPRVMRLKQAIADYEQLFGNSETLGGEHV